MADAIRLELVTPQRAVLSTTCQEVLQLPGRDGLVGVLPDHAPLMTTLSPGVVAYLDEAGQTTSAVIAGGFALVQDDVVTVLAEAAELASEVDGAAAQQDLETAREALAGAESPEAETTAYDQIAHAEARIALAEGAA